MTSIESFLITSENKIKLFFNAIPMPTYVWQRIGEDFVLIDFNNAAAEDTNGKIKDFIGKKASEYYRENSLIIADIEQCLHKKQCFTREVKSVLKKNALDKYISHKYGYIPPDLILVCAEDITEKKLVEKVLKKTQRTLKRSNRVLRRSVQERTQKLKESEKRCQLISENAKDILIMTNKKYEPEYVNEQALKNLLGYTKQDVIGLSGLKFIHHDDVQTALLSVKRGIEEGQGVAEIRYRHKEGHYVWMEATGKTFRDDKDELKGVVILRDITERKSLKAELIDSEQKYRLISENAQDILILTNEKYQIEYVNNYTLKKLLGYTDKEVIGCVGLAFIHPEDLKKTTKALKIGAEEGEGLIEIRARHKDGHYIWIEATGKTFADDTGALKGILIIREITKRKLLETKLKESEEKYRHLFEKSPYMIILINEKGDIIDFNQNTFKYLRGFSRNDLINKNFLKLDFIPIEHMKQLREIYKEVFKKGYSDPLEFQMDSSKKNLVGTKLTWIEIQSTKVKVGEEDLIQVIIRDISKRKEGEEQMRDREEMFRKFFEESQDGVLLTDESGYIRKWNKGQERIFGTRKSEIIGNPVWDAFFMQLPEELKTTKRYRFLQSTIENFFKTGKASWLNQLQEIDTQKSDGTYQCIQQRPFSIETRKGYMLGSVNRDITERKLAEQKLKVSEEKYRAAYEQADFYKNLFAHDISNILTIIDWSSQLGLNSLQKQDSLKDLEDNLNKIKEQTSRAKNLIKNVQKLSDLDGANVTLKPIKICKILEECVNSLQDSYKEKPIEIKIKASENNYSVYANELLVDVCENILINGINHNQNAEIRIVIKISLDETEKGQFLKIEFIDTGIGILDERKETIFQKGFSKDEHSKGMGFGLTLVKKIIDSYKGKIWIEDRIPGDYTQGSNFIILLPLAES